MELLKDYDCTILYHSGKEHVVADAFSWNSMGSSAHIANLRRPLIYELHELETSGVHFKITETSSFSAHVRAKSSLVQKVKELQGDNLKLSKLRSEEKDEKAQGFSLDEKEVLWFKNQLCMSDVESLRREIMEKAHKFAYVVHPSATKLCQDLK